jgi:thioredoxin-related protein
MAAVIASSAAAQSSSPAQIRTAFTHRNVDQAWQAAQRKGRPLLVFVSETDCHLCHKMLRETYAHPLIAAQLPKSLMAAIVTKEERPDLIEKLGVQAFPTTLIVSPTGKLLARIEGYAGPKEFVNSLRPALAPSTDEPRTASRKD